MSFCFTAPSHHTQQYCVGCGILQVSGIHNLPESEVGTQHQHHHQEGPAALQSLSGLDRPPNWIRTDSNGQSGLQKRSSVPTCPPSKTCTPPESGNGQEKSLQTPHTPDTN